MLKFKIVYYKMSKTKYGIIPLEKQTLDSINVCIMENIDKLKEVNIENNDKIKKLEKELTKYESIENEEKNEHDFEKIYELKREIQELKNVIDSNNELEYDYFFDTGDNLFRYYTNNEKDIEEDVNSNMTKIVKRYKRSQKKTILNDYTSSINSIVDINTLKINEDSCSNCKTELQLLSNESKMICPNCGLQSNILIDTDKATYNDPPLENTYFAYKRLNHLNECLVQFQAKENTIIPQEVCDIIKYELVKERKTDLSKLTPSMVRGYLKKHSDKGFNKYYEHIPHILNRLNGVKPKTFTTKMEDDIRKIFMMSQEPFEKHSKTTRNNFLSYNYFLNKSCRILEYDEELCNCFPLLKSEEKLRYQDELWEKICKDLNLPFHSSFDNPSKQKNNDIYWKKILQ
jgi:hypothetical protein